LVSDTSMNARRSGRDQWKPSRLNPAQTLFGFGRPGGTFRSPRQIENSPRTRLS